MKKTSSNSPICSLPSRKPNSISLRFLRRLHSPGSIPALWRGPAASLLPPASKAPLEPCSRSHDKQRRTWDDGRDRNRNPAFTRGGSRGGFSGDKGRGRGYDARSRGYGGRFNYYRSCTDKKEIKFSSYIRKFRVEQLQSHIWGRASGYMTLQLLHSEFPFIWEKFDFLFYQCDLSVSMFFNVYIKTFVCKKNI